MNKLIANDVEEPTSNVYRITIINLSGNDKEVKTITAENPDDAVGRVIDMLSGGLYSPEEFWDKYKLLSIIQELQ